MSESKRVRIMIVEDHFVVRVGLAAIINSQADMTTVAEAGNGRQAVELFEQHQPDVTLMDLRIPGMDGIEAIAAIKRMLEQGITPEELAQARASLDAMNLPRQGQLPLAVRR